MSNLVPAARQGVLLQYEASTIEFTGRNGKGMGIEYAHAALDGTANAMVRIEGAEAAFSYVMALGDRVAGGVRDATDWRDLARQCPPDPAPPPPTEPPPSAGAGAALAPEPVPPPNLTRGMARQLMDAAERRRGRHIRLAVAALGIVFLAGLIVGRLL